MENNFTIAKIVSASVSFKAKKMYLYQISENVKKKIILSAKKLKQLRL